MNCFCFLQLALGLSVLLLQHLLLINIREDKSFANQNDSILRRISLFLYCTSSCGQYELDINCPAFISIEVTAQHIFLGR